MVLLWSASQTALRMSEPGGGTGRDCRAPKAGRHSVSTACPHACETFARMGIRIFRLTPQSSWKFYNEKEHSERRKTT